jgi:CHAT domain-containing protein/tetratricopeptide (TPR) repeat protein
MSEFCSTNSNDSVATLHFACMKKRFRFLLSCAMLFTALLQGQCPQRDTLRKRVLYLKDILKSPLQDQLKELLAYADKMNDCAYKNDSTHVFLLGRIADIYFNQADYLKTVQYRRQAIDIITANAGKPSVNVRSLPGRYYYLSIAYDSLNNFSGKMNALDSASAIAMRLKYMDRASLTALYTRVEYYFAIGDYHRCIDYATKCEQLAREYANIKSSDGLYYASSSLGWHVEALLKLKQFEPAEAFLADKIDAYKKAGLKSYLGLVYGQLGQVQEQKGNFEKALTYFNQSLRYYQEDKDYFNCKQTLKDIGNIYSRHFGDSDKALAYYRKALKYIYSNGDEFSKTDYDFESLNILANIGTVYVQKGDYDTACKYFQLAFDQVKPGSTEEDILNSTPQEMMQFKTNYYLTDLLINKGDAFRKQYENNNQKTTIEKAISIYKVADQLLDRIKAEQTDLQSKLFWRSDSRRLYEYAIEACYLQGNTSDAFYFFEKSRAVLLNDQLNEKKFAAEKDIMQQTEIQKKILQLQNEFDKTDKRSARFSELQNELFSRKQELDHLKEVIKTKNPLYYQSFLDPTFITVADIKQRILNDHSALVEIFTGDSAVYALVVTKQNVHLKKIGKASYEKLTASFVNYISNFDLLNSNYESFRKISGDLYQLIFQDISLPPGRLIISPDEQYFPFEALIINKPGQPVKWFVEDYAVSYTYSARFLMNDFNSGQTPGSNFLGIAPVNYPAAFSLASLPGSDHSLHKIADYFSNAVSEVALDASRKNFLKQYSQYSIIQLYTHAADSSMHNEPVIYFADSALYLSDLVNEYKPLTRLIVLSACETGKGKIYQGEGVFSFNRGFAALGIPAAITNLWSVDDGSTYLLTELFYKWLAKGLPTDVALQKAKLEFLQTTSKEKAMPCYWAGPVLVGKTDKIELSKPYHWKWLAVFAGIAVIVFYVMRKRVRFERHKE